MGRAAGGGTAFSLGEWPQALEVMVVECLDAPFHPPAAALRELGTQRDDAAAARAAPLSQCLPPPREGPPPACGAEKPARRPHHHDSPRLARARPLGLDEADERRGALGFDRLDEATIGLHGRDVSTKPATVSPLAGAGSGIEHETYPSLRAQRSNPGATSRGPWVASSQGLLATTAWHGNRGAFPIKRRHMSAAEVMKR